ncbi:unnamed protein product [Urochloa humidicola]
MGAAQTAEGGRRDSCVLQWNLCSDLSLPPVEFAGRRKNLCSSASASPAGASILCRLDRPRPRNLDGRPALSPASASPSSPVHYSRASRRSPPSASSPPQRRQGRLSRSEATWPPSLHPPSPPWSSTVRLQLFFIWEVSK